MRKLLGLALVAMLAAPAGAAVLIDNNPNVSDGGLNTAPPGAWTKTGDGPNARLENDHAVTPDDGGDWAVGGSDGSGSSPPYDNYYSQTFAPPSGAGEYLISLSGWSKAWAGWWSGENWNWVQEAHIELYVDGVLVFDGLSSNNTNRDVWALHTYVGTHIVNTSIEVRLHSVKGNDNYGQGGLGAIFFDSRFDDIRLIASSTSECLNPTSITSLTPAGVTTPPALGVTRVNVAGTNLDAVTAVELTGPATIPGSIFSQSGTLIEVDFDLSAAPLGDYTVVAERTEPCPNASYSPFTIGCSVGSASPIALQDDLGMKGDDSHTVRIVGTNVTILSGVKLVRPITGGEEIVGTDLTPDGDDLLVTFDLSTAAGGAYDVVFTHPCGLVSPASLERAFLVYMPEFTNGGFEDGDTGNEQDMPGWTFKKFYEADWGEPAPVLRKIGGYQTFGGEIPFEGAYFAGTDYSGQANFHVGLYQTFVTVPGIIYDVTGGYMGGLEAVSDDTAWWEIEVVPGATSDPDAPGTLIARKERPPGEGYLDFREEFAGQFVAEQPLTTIFLKWGRIPTDTWLIEAAGFDNLVVASRCPSPFADVDQDGDVDQTDFAMFQVCYTGAGGTIPAEPAYCVCLDPNLDGSIDQTDAAAFEACASGAGIPVDPDCD